MNKICVSQSRAYCTFVLVQLQSSFGTPARFVLVINLCDAVEQQDHQPIGTQGVLPSPTKLCFYWLRISQTRQWYLIIASLYDVPINLQIILNTLSTTICNKSEHNVSINLQIILNTLSSTICTDSVQIVVDNLDTLIHY